MVLAGYAGAFAVAFAVSWARERMMQEADPNQFSGGMAAFGDSLFFLGLFGALSLVPTAMALFFLRPFPKFWNFLSQAALIVSFTTPVAVILFFTSHSRVAPNWLNILGFLALIKLLSTPFFAFGFLITACISPPQPRRRLLFIAAAIEGVVCACAAIFLAVILFFNR